MSARYSVIQYLPDPATDERINVGVLAFGDRDVHARFVRNWARVGAFGGSDISFLRNFAKQVEEATAAQERFSFGEFEPLDRDALLAAAGKWSNSIQITDPRASTLGPQELVEQAAKRFLRDSIPRRRGRDRRTAAAAASRSLTSALRAEGSKKPEKYVKRNQIVAGELEDHEFDVAVVNGATQLGVLAISFEGGTPTELLREVRANAWTIDDVRSVDRDLAIAVVALPPRSRSKTYEHAKGLFEGLETDLVEESEIDEWAGEAAREVLPQLGLRGSAAR